MDILTFHKVYNNIQESPEKPKYENESKSLDVYEIKTGYCTVVASHDKMPFDMNKRYLSLVTRKKHTHTVRGFQAQMLFDLVSRKHQKTN